MIGLRKNGLQSPLIVQVKGDRRIAQESPDQTIGGLTCQHCEQTGPDVETESNYVGGRGYVDGDYCQDIRACWIRFDNSTLGR